MTLTTIADLSKIVAFGGDDPDVLGTNDPEEKENEPGLEEPGLEGDDVEEEDPEKELEGELDEDDDVEEE